MKTTMYLLTPDQQVNVRRLFNNLLTDLKTRNEDIYNEFVTAPAAKNHHQNYKGGLLEHSGKFAMWLYGRALAKEDLDISIEECVKIGFFHDFCKLFLYIPNNGTYWVNSDVYPHHAKRSVEIAKELGYNFSQKEKICILFHMAGGWWNDEDEEELTTSDRRWISKNLRLVSAIQWADMKACE